MARQAEHRRIVNDLGKRIVAHFLNNIETIANELRNIGALKERLRPGIAAADLQNGWIEFDGGDVRRALRGGNRCIAQPGGRVQYGARKGTGSPDLGFGIALRVGSLNAVHGNSRNQHGGTHRKGMQ